MTSRSAFIVAGSCVALAIPVFRVGPDPQFRSSLTATVISGRTVRERAGCATISLVWRAHAGATGYQGYVAGSRTGDWRTLPLTTPCHAAHGDGKTGIVDEEPAEPTIPRRLFYRVVALGLKGAIDTTDIVPVEIPPRTQPGSKP